MTCWLVYNDLILCTIIRKGEIIEPWGTPAGHGLVDDNVPAMLTRRLLPSKKLCVQSHMLFVTFILANFHNKLPWFTMWKALQKSMNRTCTPFLLSRRLSVTLNQFCDLDVKADAIDHLAVNGCWLAFIFKSELFNLRWSFSRTFAV